MYDLQMFQSISFSSVTWMQNNSSNKAEKTIHVKERNQTALVQYI